MLRYLTADIVNDGTFPPEDIIKAPEHGKQHELPQVAEHALRVRVLYEELRSIRYNEVSER